MHQDLLSYTGEKTIIIPTYKELAYNSIKDAILYRRLKVGEVYSQDGICAELGITRTPVREALLELQKEGYINFFRGRGIEIVPVTHKQAKGIVEMRFIIELVGSELAAQRRTEQHLENLKANIDAMKQNANKTESTSMYKLDRQFHVHLFEAADNEYMLKSIENLRDQFLRLETQDAFNNTQKSLQVLEEHKQIYDAVKAGDSVLARQAMQRHLDLTYARTVKPVIDSLKA